MHVLGIQRWEKFFPSEKWETCMRLSTVESEWDLDMSRWVGLRGVFQDKEIVGS